MCHFWGHRPYRSTLWGGGGCGVGVDEGISCRHACCYLTIAPLKTENNLTVYSTHNQRGHASTGSSLLWSDFCKRQNKHDLMYSRSADHGNPKPSLSLEPGCWSSDSASLTLPASCVSSRPGGLDTFLASLNNKSWGRKERQCLRLENLRFGHYGSICLGERELGFYLVRILHVGFLWLTNIPVIVSICFFMWKQIKEKQ